MWQTLNRLRLELVARSTAGTVHDIGSGAGCFVDLRNQAGLDTLGFDVIPEAVELLGDRFRPPGSVHAMSFWDSLEHIKNPEHVLNMAQEFVFVSIPIFSGLDDIKKSKHYKPQEHFHYYTHQGFVGFMWDLGFRLVEWNRHESEAGRVGIRSFAFKRS